MVIKPGSAPTRAFNSLQRAALRILRRFGTDAHVYTAGANGAMVNLLQTGNYILSDGSTGFSAVDGPAGLVLDGAGSVGSELVTNGTNLVTTTGWTQGVASTISAVGGQLSVTRTSNVNDSAYQTIACTIGQTYQLSYTASGTAPIITIATSNNFGGTAIATSATTNGLCFVATATTHYIGCTSNTNASTALFNNISVKQVTGIHATQATTANKPTVRRGAFNQIRNSAMAGASVGNFPTGWVVAPASGLTWSVTGTGSENGFNYVDVRLSGTAVGTSSSTVLSGAVNHIAGASGQVFTNSEYIRRQAGTLTNVSATVLIVGQSNDGVGIGSAPGVNTYTVPSTGDLSACRATVTGTLTASAVNVVPYFQVNTVAGAVDVTFRMAAPQCETGSIASDYSPTTSAAASNPSAGRYSWSFDGGDSLALGSVPFTQADDFAVICACRLDALPASQRTLYSHSNASNHQIAWLFYNATGNLVWTSFDGTTIVNISSPSTYLLTPLVVSLRKVGSTGVLRINGVQVATASLAAITSPALTSATIGGFNGGNLQHVGLVSRIEPLKGTFSDADMLTMERECASTLPNAPSF